MSKFDVFIDQLGIDTDSLEQDRQYVVDTRYQQIEQLLDDYEIRTAYTQFSELFQMVFQLSGTLFAVNEFSLSYTENLKELQLRFQELILNKNQYLDLYFNLQNISNIILYIEFLGGETSKENYKYIQKELKSFRQRIFNRKDSFTSDNIEEFTIYHDFLDLASIMIYAKNFGPEYFDKMKKLIDKAVTFFRSEPRINDPMAFANLCFNLGGVLLESDLETAREIMEFGLNLSQQYDAQALITRAYTMLGHYYRLNGELDLAFQTYQQCLQTDRVPLIMYNYAIRHIGHIYQTRGELNTALLYYKKSLDLFEFVDNYLGMARTLQYIGNIHYLHAEFPAALEYYGKSLTLIRMRDYPRMIVDLLYSHIRVYLELDDLDQAREFLEEIKNIHEAMDHKGISQVYMLSEALVLKTQPRRVKKAKAQQLLEALLEEEQVNHEYTIVAMQQLCELLVDEMRSEFAEEIFEEATILVDGLYQLGKEQQLYQVQIQALILQSQFDMVQGLFDNTLNKLSQAEEMGQQKDLPQLTQYVRQFRKRFQAEFSKWQVIIAENETLEDRLANEEIQEYIKIALTTVQEEKQQTEALLKTVLPEEIIPYLHNNQEIYAERFEKVSILFADIVGFTTLSEHRDPHEMVLLLNEIFSNFDQYLQEFDVEKIRTIGDNYMVVVGAPRRNDLPSRQIARFALKISQYLNENKSKLAGITFRMGINTGEVVAAVVGTDKYNFDVWGDAVNIAARMESHGIPGKIQVTERVYHDLKDEFIFEERGLIDIKGKQPMKTYFLLAERKP